MHALVQNRLKEANLKWEVGLQGTGVSKENPSDSQQLFEKVEALSHVVLYPCHRLLCTLRGAVSLQK